MNTTRSTAPGMRLVAAALTATIATAGLGLAAGPVLADEQLPADGAAEAPAEDAAPVEGGAADPAAETPADQPAAPANVAVSSLTADQVAADPALAAQAAGEALGVTVELTNDADQTAQLYDAVDALRAEAGLGALTRDAGLEGDAYQRAAESTLLAAGIRPDGSLFSGIDGRIAAEILVRATADGATDAATALSALTDDQRALLTSEDVTNVGVGTVVDAAGTVYWAIELSGDAAASDGASVESGAASYLVNVAAANVQLGATEGELSVEAGSAQAAAIPVTVAGDIAYGSGTATFSGASADLDNASLVWNSGDTAVATVDASGVVTGVGSGTCTVSGSGTAGTFVYTVTVTGGEPAASTVNLADCTIAGITGPYEATGEPIAPAFTVIDPNSSTVDPSQYTYTFSDNVEPGTATLTVAAAEGSTAVTGTATRTFEIVSPAPAQVAVPSVLSAGIEEATQAIDDAGLQATPVAGDPAPDEESEGEVYATDPAAGTTVDAGTSVTLSYYTTADEETAEQPEEGEQTGEEAGAEDGQQTSEEGTEATDGGQPAEGEEGEQPGEDAGDQQPADGTETGDGTETTEDGQPAEDEENTEDEEGSEGEAATTDIAQNRSIADIAPQTYTGEEIRPTVTLNGTALEGGEGVDYEVSYSNNVNPGTATVTITGIGAYSGTLTATFQIVGDVSQAQVTLSGADNIVYSGSPVTPVPTVQIGGTLLTSGTDYDVAYADNVNAGTATVTITGKGNYTGTKTVEFAIAAKSIKEAEISPIATATYTGSPITPAVTVTDGTTVLANGTDYTVSYEQNTNAGTAHVVVTGTGNYAGSIDTTFVIAPLNMTGTTIVMPNMNYTGQALTPTPVSVSYKLNDETTLTLVAGTDYDIVGYSNNTNVGNATATLQGKGNFTGTVTANWKVVDQNTADSGTTETLPKTGDSTNIAAMAVGAVVGVALVVTAVALIVRRVRANKRSNR